MCINESFFYKGKITKRGKPTLNMKGGAALLSEAKHRNIGILLVFTTVIHVLKPGRHNPHTTCDEDANFFHGTPSGKYDPLSLVLFLLTNSL